MSISFWPAIQSTSGGSFGSPGVIARDSQWTVANVTASSGADFAALPSGCDIGDVVEVHAIGSAISVSAPSGESFNRSSNPTLWSGLFRKIDTALWGCIG